MGDNWRAGRGFQPDSDVHITMTDQQKINHFSKCHTKYSDLLADLKTKETELKTLEDVTEELVLHDDSEKVRFRQGKVFLCLTLDDAKNALEKEKKRLINEIKELQEASEELKTLLSNLKIQLYADFGSHINLED